MLPSFNLEYMHKSWSYLTTKLWNGLPTRDRECPDLVAFRRALLFFYGTALTLPDCHGSGWLGQTHRCAIP